MILQVMGLVDQSDLAFHFGRHLLEERAEPVRSAVSLHFASHTGVGQVAHEVRVLDGEGRVLRRWAYHGIGGIPPVLPPFAVMEHPYAVVQAAVLAKGPAVVALVGGIGSPRNSVALALGARGWRMVSGQYLVVDRVTGETLPYQLPLELRGPALEAARAGGLTDGPRDDVRTVCSPLTGPSVMVRPERLIATAGILERFGPATLVRLCSRGTQRSRLEDWNFAASVWPPDASADPAFAATPRMRLLLPESGAAEEAADLLDGRLSATTPKGTVPCPAEARTLTELLAGSTT
ncbi:hypothetical protein [Streptomyces sp. NPDC003952]